MKSLTDRVDCYIASFKRPLKESCLEREGIAQGMVLFAIPSYGILFKCRARGTLRELEVGALLALLRFLDTSLKEEKITKIKVHSSTPDIVFSLVHRRHELTSRQGRQKKLDRHFRKFEIMAAYAPPGRNRALAGPEDLPSVPQGQKSPLSPAGREKRKPRLEAIRKGVDL
jgi:hypothetical protein